MRLGPVRRHAGIDPGLRSRDPALDPPTQGGRRCCRSARPCWTRAPSVGFAPGYLEAFGAPGDDPLYCRPISVRAGASPGLEHYLPLFYDELDRPCSTTLPERQPDRARSPREGSPRRTPGHASRTPSMPARRPARAGVNYQALAAAGAALSRLPRMGCASGASGPGAVLPPSSGRGRGPTSTWAPAAVAASAAERKLDSVNLFEAPADHAKALSGPRASGCCSRPGPRARPSAWATCWPTMACRRLALRALLGRGHAPPIRKQPQRVVLPLDARASRPTAWRSSPRPTFWATGWRGRAKSGAPPISWPRPQR